MTAKQDLIAAALALCDVAATDYEGAYRAKRDLREACARAMVQPDVSEPRFEMNGWKEATIAWAICASIHREYAKKKDPFFTTRQNDFVRHEEAARAKALAPVPDVSDVEQLLDLYADHVFSDGLLGSKIPSGRAATARTALLDAVRAIVAERDHFRDAAKIVSAAPQPVSDVPMPEVAYLYTLEYGSSVADTKVSVQQLNYPFGVCGADYLWRNEDGISYVRQTPLYAATLHGEVKP